MFNMKHKRSFRLSTYITKSQHEQIIRDADIKGVSLSNYLLDALLHPMIQIDKINKIMNKLNRLSTDDKEITDLIRNLINFEFNIRHSPETIRKFQILKVQLQIYYKHLLNKK